MLWSARLLFAFAVLMSACGEYDKPDVSSSGSEVQAHTETAMLLEAPVLLERGLRGIDGTGNNPDHLLWGSANVALHRMMASSYEDGLSAPPGQDRPSAREVSNFVHAQATSLPNPNGASDYLWQWGQVVDHDIDLTEIASPEEPFPILVPTGDPFFDPQGAGTRIIPLMRSLYARTPTCSEPPCPRQQMNGITAFIDASFVYGSTTERQHELRANDGSGRLRTSAGDLLPLNDNALPNAAPPGADPSRFFLAGDIRANEQIGLTAMHTLFVREHNRLADRLGELHPGMSGDDIYEIARALVAAKVQVITYQEFLPLLLGEGALAPYVGYDSAVKPDIANEFSTGAFRFGHSLLSSHILRLEADGSPIAQGHAALRDSFFVPERIRNEGGIEPILRGLAAQEAQDLDVFVIDDARNFLFGPPGSGGMDLASLNIQRGRDHGLPSYTAARQAMRLTTVTSFSDISSDPIVQSRLEEAYGTVGRIDLWTGALAEDHLTGSLVGELLMAILVDQFERLRDGDRFFYKAYFPPDLVSYIESLRLSDVIRMNTSIGDELRNDVFTVPDGCLDNSFSADLPQGGLLIPDRSRFGVSVPVHVTGGGIVEDLRVMLHITHTWRGDLTVELIAPSGQVAILHDRGGYSEDDLVFMSMQVPELEGELVSGTWTLRVRDLAYQDVGTVDEFTLSIRSDCTGGTQECAHPLCDTGASLLPGCSPCATEVCNVDPFCCEVRWDSICVDEVATVCDASCF